MTVCAWCDEPMEDGRAWWGEPACSVACRAGLDAELDDEDPNLNHAGRLVQDDAACLPACLNHAVSRGPLGSAQ